MEFNVNSPILFVLAGIIILAVLAQSVFFLIKAWRRGLKIGMPKEKLKRIAMTAAVFTIAPAIAIVISVIALAKDLGLPLPWLRLSVIGSLSYETVAASNAESAMGLKFGQVESLTASQYVTISLVMTICILIGLCLCPIIGEKYQKGIGNIKKKDGKWSEILFNSLFIGMISAFVGFVFCDVAGVVTGDMTGLIPVCVFFISAAIMIVMGLTAKKYPNAHWIADYALPLSLILGMASAIPITAWLG